MDPELLQDWPGPLPGLPDAAYENDGLITRAPLRAMALAYLRPSDGAMLWDLGAGSGAVAIEWARAAAKARAIGVERKPDRISRAAANAVAHQVADRVQFVAGELAEVLPSLAEVHGPPQAIFIGGGGSSEVVEAAWQTLNVGGRLVVHTVTLETEQVVVAAQARHGGELTRLSLEFAEPLGSFRGWKPARPIVQWAISRV